MRGVGTRRERDEQRGVGGRWGQGERANLREGRAERGCAGPTGVRRDGGVGAVDCGVQLKPWIRERAGDAELVEAGADATDQKGCLLYTSDAADE